MNEMTIQFTIGFKDPDLEDEQRLKLSRKLLSELRELDEVTKAERAEDLKPEAGSKPGLAMLLGVLTAEVNIKNIKEFLEFLGNRLQDKPIEIVVKLGDKEVAINAKSKQEFALAEQTVVNLISAMQGGKSG